MIRSVGYYAYGIPGPAFTPRRANRSRLHSTRSAPLSPLHQHPRARLSEARLPPRVFSRSTPLLLSLFGASQAKVSAYRSSRGCAKCSMRPSKCTPCLRLAPHFGFYSRDTTADDARPAHLTRYMAVSAALIKAVVSMASCGYWAIPMLADRDSRFVPMM